MFWHWHAIEENMQKRNNNRSGAEPTCFLEISERMITLLLDKIASTEWNTGNIVIHNHLPPWIMSISTLVLLPFFSVPKLPWTAPSSTSTNHLKLQSLFAIWYLLGSFWYGTGDHVVISWGWSPDPTVTPPGPGSWLSTFLVGDSYILENKHIFQKMD